MSEHEPVPPLEAVSRIVSKGTSASARREGSATEGGRPRADTSAGAVNDTFTATLAATLPATFTATFTAIFAVTFTVTFAVTLAATLAATPAKGPNPQETTGADSTVDEATAEEEIDIRNRCLAIEFNEGKGSNLKYLLGKGTLW